MHEVLWQGAPKSALDDEYAIFQSSLRFDKRLARHDLRSSIVHAKMLADQGIITEDEGRTLIAGLQEIEQEIDEGRWTIDEPYEDIHSAIEMRLKSKIGTLSGKLHTARSRNDQIATDLRLFINEACLEHRQAIAKLRQSLLIEAERHLNSRDGGPAVLPGYTHMQAAQPLHLSHWFLAYAEMLARDENRFFSAAERINECPLGAAALAGTSWTMLVIYFNREIEIVPGTEDGIMATLSGATKAALIDEVLDDEQPNSVGVAIEGNVLTLTPKWKTDPDADPAKEIDLAITYMGVVLRPKASPETASETTVGGTVPFYK